MKDIEDKFNKDIIRKEKIEALKNNADIVKKMIPICKSLKSEMCKAQSYYSVYDLKLGRLSESLGEIKAKNERLKIAINNKIKIFETLRDIVVDSELKDEHFEILESSSLKTTEGLVRIEQAFAIFEEYQQNDLDIRILKERKLELNKRLNRFFEKFSLFFDDLLKSIDSRSQGQLKVHSYIYEEVLKFSFIFKFAFNRQKEAFSKICDIYLKRVKAIYDAEIQKHLKIISKVATKKEINDISDVMNIFMESLFMIIKCEVHFCKTNLFSGNDVTEFVAGIFRGVFDAIHGTFYEIFKIKSLVLICALNKDFHFKYQNEEKKIWMTLQKKIKQNKEIMKSEFLKRQKNKLESNIKSKTLNQFLEYIKICNDLNITEKLVEMIKTDILNDEKEDLEYLIYSLKLLYQLNDHLSSKEELSSTVNEINVAICKKLKELEKMSISYILEGDSSKIVKRARNVINMAGDNREIISFIQKAVLESSRDEQKRELKPLFKE